jgi:hypothetical protein
MRTIHGTSEMKDYGLLVPENQPSPAVATSGRKTRLWTACKPRA